MEGMQSDFKVEYMIETTGFRLIQSMRWYGPSDAVSLQDIRQAGCSHVVTALHQVPVGALWEKRDVEERKNQIEAAGMFWTVVESLPVHEEIKMQTGDWKGHLERYKKSIENLAICGIKVITYNFMPVLDWLRTDIHYKLESGAEALMFDWVDYGVFDLYLLGRKEAHKDYSSEDLASFAQRYERMDAEKQANLYRNMLLGLPGSDESFTPGKVNRLLKQYDKMDAQTLKKHLFEFLQEVIPVAEKTGAVLAIHPDDPPYPVLGLPRVMSGAKDIEDLISTIPSPSNGLCFCTGSYGARADNDLVEMIQRWGDRIYFFHLRNTRRLPGRRTFYEADHLDGDTDMQAVMGEIVHLMQTEKRNIPMRPDHGHRILDDLDKKSYPGYSAIGRLKGLAELRGLEMGIHYELSRKR